MFGEHLLDALAVLRVVVYPQKMTQLASNAARHDGQNVHTSTLSAHTRNNQQGGKLCALTWSGNRYHLNGCDVNDVGVPPSGHLLAHLQKLTDSFFPFSENLGGGKVSVRAGSFVSAAFKQSAPLLPTGAHCVAHSGDPGSSVPGAGADH